MSYRSETCGKNHTITENLISSYIKDAIQCMFTKENVKNILNIPISNNTISR